MNNVIEYSIKNLNKEKTLRQLLTICNVKDIKISDNCFAFSVPYGKRKQVDSMLLKADIKILNKTHKGFFAFLNKTIFRIGVIIPIILFAVFAIIANQFVFNYQFQGNELVKNDEIVEVLKNNKVYGIVQKQKIDTKSLQLELQKLESVSFASVIIKGNTLVVNIKEKIYNAEYIEKDEFLPLKSNFNGIITEISVVQGTPLVSVGQTVTVGQELVSPYIKDTSGQSLAVKPMADIKADVFLTTTTIVPNTKTVYSKTGKTITHKTISLFGLNIYSHTPKNDFAIYECETLQENLTNLILPFKICTTTFYEQTQTQIDNYFNANKNDILVDCQQKTRQLVNSCEIIKDEYYVITQVADLNQITCTVVVNKSIC